MKFRVMVYDYDRRIKLLKPNREYSARKGYLGFVVSDSLTCDCNQNANS